MTVRLFPASRARAEPRSFANSLFGKGGGGGAAQYYQMLQSAQQIAQQQASLTATQGQQLALLSKNQAQADNETASMSRPGLGRALLTYAPRDRQNTSQTLG